MAINVNPPRCLRHLLCIGLIVSASLVNAAQERSAGGINETAAATTGPFFYGGSEGWFWYEDPPLPEEEKEEKLEEPPQSLAPADKAEEPEQKKGPEPFSVQWLRQNMPILLDRAINDPTKENVEAYEYAKRVLLDRAQRYAEQTRDVVANDPLLDENNRVPLSTFAKKEFLANRKDGLADALKYLSGVAGIWMFFDSTCSFCHLQASQIMDLAKDYKFHTRFISMNGQGMPMLPEWYVDAGHAKALGLTMTPTTVLVVPPDKYYIISQGAMARDQLEERILVAADSNGLLPEDKRAGTRAFDKGVLRSEDLEGFESDDPKVWVQRLKEKLKGRY
ncbi:conjugal transfer protein TraF [Allopusillimonas ginsengisoli]|uniref:conjugal transfer protein TraF n=1 Tax=Allopusillimonas ginsengisoli TaxID=453575 RepID=UPI0039C1A9C9